MSWTKEDKLILQLSKKALDNETAVALERLNKDALDWNYFITTAKKNAVFSLIYHHLKDKKGIIPKDTKRKLQSLYIDNSSRNLLLLEELQKALSTLRIMGIPVIILKGMNLLENVYENIALRPMTDIDILIRKEDLARFDACVRKIGFSTSYNYQDYINLPQSSYLNTIVYQKEGKSCTFLHLHWHIINSTVPLFDNIIENINMEKIWQEAMSTKISEVETLSLSPHHQLLYLSLHAFNHSFDRHILLCDISEVINTYIDNLDWKQLLKDAFDFNLNRIVYYGLYLSHTLLDAKVPAYVLSKLKPTHLSYGERKLITLVLNNLHYPNLCLVVRLFMIDGLTERLKFFTKTFFPPHSILKQRYAVSNSKPTPWRQAFRIARGLKSGINLLFYLIKKY